MASVPAGRTVTWVRQYLDPAIVALVTWAQDIKHGASSAYGLASNPKALFEYMFGRQRESKVKNRNQDLPPTVHVQQEEMAGRLASTRAVLWKSIKYLVAAFVVTLIATIGGALFLPLLLALISMSAAGGAGLLGIFAVRQYRQWMQGETDDDGRERRWEAYKSTLVSPQAEGVVESETTGHQDQADADGDAGAEAGTVVDRATNEDRNENPDGEWEETGQRHVEPSSDTPAGPAADVRAEASPGSADDSAINGTDHPKGRQIGRSRSGRSRRNRGGGGGGGNGSTSLPRIRVPQADIGSGAGSPVSGDHS